MFPNVFDRFASGFDKLDNGFDRLSNGLDKFVKGFDRFARGFLSIFNRGLVRFLMELSCVKPVIPEALVLALSPDATTELEIKNTRNKHESMLITIKPPKLVGDLLFLRILLRKSSFTSSAMQINIQYTTLTYLASRDNIVLLGDNRTVSYVFIYVILSFSFSYLFVFQVLYNV